MDELVGRSGEEAREALRIALINLEAVAPAGKWM